MSQTVSAAPHPGPAGRPAAGLRRHATPPHVWAFRRLTSMRVALMLLFVMGLLTLAGTLLSQAPDAVRDNQAAYSEWLSMVRPKYGGWTGILNALGLFSVFSSIWFRGTLLLLSASLITCSLRRSPGLWRTAAKPRMVMTEAFFERAPHREMVPSQQDPGAALLALRAAFAKNRFHVATATDGEDVHVCADRFRWAPLGRVLIHMSFVLILAGALLTATGGFRDESFAVPIGDRVNVGHGTGLAVEAKSFTDSYYPSGPPRSYDSQLVLYRGGAMVKAQEDRVNHPVRYDGVTFYQSFFGPAVKMQARTGDGRVVFNQGVAQPYSSQDEKERIGRFSLPSQGLTVFAVSPASGEVDPRIPVGEVRLEVFRTAGETPVGVQVVSPGKPATIGGVAFTFVRELEFTGLIVAEDPGSTVVWIGSALLIVGLIMVFYFRHRRVRAVIRPRAGASEIAIASIERHDEGYADRFERLVEDIRRALSGGARPEKGGTVDA